jgi:hypothetical protein
MDNNYTIIQVLQFERTVAMFNPVGIVGTIIHATGIAPKRPGTTSVASSRTTIDWNRGTFFLQFICAVEL